MHVRSCGILSCLLLNFVLSAGADDHTKLSWYRTASGSIEPITTLPQWTTRRTEILDQMQRVMGPLPDRSQWPSAEVRVLERTELTEGLIRQKIQYTLDSVDRSIKAWVFLPDARRFPGRRPAVLCLHQTIAIGKDEPAGLGGNPHLHYALELGQRGFVTLAPDYPSFGESTDAFPVEHGYISGTMKAVAQNMRAIDVLQAIEPVSTQRIGCIGHSLGGHNTMFTAAFDPRIQALVTSCGFTRFHKYYGGQLQGWTSARYMPLIASQFHNSPDEVPFDFPEIVATFAPRPFLACSPTGDSNFEVSGVRDTMHAAQPIYQLLKAESALQATYPECGHDFPDETREKAYQFLEKHLGVTP
ncbi:MAG: alpha/beta fold hydrolase [Planctomycetota bacterium]|nr:MAG: alpha/beta fold hydrolase [Planctomycetota bacterium]